jgi:hypothetical protein
VSYLTSSSLPPRIRMTAMQFALAEGARETTSPASPRENGLDIVHPPVAPSPSARPHPLALSTPSRGRIKPPATSSVWLTKRLAGPLGGGFGHHVEASDCSEPRQASKGARR